MKNFEGTKGKWKVISGYLTTNEIEKDKRCPIATLHEMQDGKNNVQRLKESAANEKLIVATPKLLKILQKIVEAQYDGKYTLAFLNGRISNARDLINEIL